MAREDQIARKVLEHRENMSKEADDDMYFLEDMGKLVDDLVVALTATSCLAVPPPHLDVDCCLSYCRSNGLFALHLVDGCLFWDIEISSKDASTGIIC